jgi:hypothetical protein
VHLYCVCCGNILDRITSDLKIWSVCKHMKDYSLLLVVEQIFSEWLIVTRYSLGNLPHMHISNSLQVFSRGVWTVLRGVIPRAAES